MTHKLVLERNLYQSKEDYAWCVKVQKGSPTIWHDVSGYCRLMMGEAGADWVSWPFGWLFKNREDALTIMLAFS